MPSDFIPDHWRKWIDHNLDKRIKEDKLLKILNKNELFSKKAIDEYFVEARASYSLYAEFIKKIKPDFNDPKQSKLNLEIVKDFLAQTKGSRSEIVYERIKDHWIMLDYSCSNLEIRACKISFFNALDRLSSTGHKLSFPNPVGFQFFPLKNDKCESLPEDLKNFENQDIATGKLIPLTKIDQDILYLIKDDADKPIQLGKGSYGTIYQGFYQNKLVAIKHLDFDKLSFFARWRYLRGYYRQSMVVFEKSFEGILPMNEIFFYKEESVFNDGGNYNILAIYPLCKDSLASRAKKGVIFNEPRDAEILKKLLKSLITLHKSNICFNDFKPDNILFDFSNNAFLHDFDFWIPKKIHDITSIYISKISIVEACCGLTETDSIENYDFSFIQPEKLDIWCFGSIIAAGLGYLGWVNQISGKNMNIRNIDRSKPLFKEKLNNLKSDIREFNDSIEKDLAKKINSEDDESKKSFLINLKEVLSDCLESNPKDRPSAESLMSYKLFKEID